MTRKHWLEEIESMLLTCKPLWKTEWPIKLASILIKAAPCGKGIEKERISTSVILTVSCDNTLFSLFHLEHIQGEKHEIISHLTVENSMFYTSTCFLDQNLLLQGENPSDTTEQSVIRNNKYFCEHDTRQT